MELKTRDHLIRYGFAFFVSGFALVLTRWISPIIQPNAFDLFQCAVFLSAWYGGLGPGVLASGISILMLDYYLIPPLHTFNLGIADILRLSIFGAVALITSSLSGRLKKAKSELQLAHDGLEARVKERTEELSRANANLTIQIAQRLEVEKLILDINGREQRKLGQDLHDSLCQTLAGARLINDILKEKLAARFLAEVEDVDLIESRLNEALTQVDTISRGLYPVELETNGLMAALQELAEKISKAYPVLCEFRSRRPVYIKGGPVATHLYRIAQEAVTNAIKGGKARRVILRLLISHHDRIVLRIMDDGAGFRPELFRKGMGLKIMDYRARMIGASLRFRSRSQGCTLVSCSLPQTNQLEVSGNGV